MPTVDVEAAVARLAACQQGIVTREQLLAVGFDAKAITRRAAGGGSFGATGASTSSARSPDPTATRPQPCSPAAWTRS
jgi:hypothetical protein